MNGMQKFEGIYPALVTPYDADGRLNTDCAQQLVEKLVGSGVSGFYVGGSTGESYLLSMRERKAMLEAVVEACPKGMPIMANIGMMATEQSVELAKHAQKWNVAAISSVPPFYFSFNMDEYVQYYNDLADAVDIPVMVYNIPAMSGIQFSKRDLDRLLRNDRVMGLKHTSYDLFQLQMLIQEYPEKNFFVGHDELFLSACAVGAQAGIGSTFNIMPEKFLKLMEYHRTGRWKEAVAMQGEINAVVSVLCEVGVFKGIKEILALQGVDCGACRKPFMPLTDAQRTLVRDVAEKAGLI